MKKYTLFSVIFLILLLSGCESESDDNINAEPNLPDVSIISIDDDMNIIQADITDNGDNIVASNLTEQMGINIPYDNVSYDNQVITFFARTLPDFTYSIYEKQVSTGEINIYEDVCTPANVNISASSRSAQKIILFSIGSTLGSNLYIQDKGNDECLTINFSDEFLTYFGTNSVDNEIIYLYHYDEANQLKVISVELNTGNVLNELTLDDVARVRIIEDSLYVQNSGGQLKIYNKNTFEFIDELQNDNLPMEFAWISHIEKSGNNIIVNYPLPAPGQFETSPAIYDISTFEIVKGGTGLAFDIRNNLIDEFGAAFDIRILDTDVHSESIVLSFRDESGNYNLLYSNFDIEILKIVPLNHEPEVMFIN